MTKLHRFLKLWPFHRMNMGRIDNFVYVLCEIDGQLCYFGNAKDEIFGIIEPVMIIATEKSAQLDYIR